MKINTLKNEPQFKGLNGSKIMLRGLEKISDHGASFAAGVSFLSAVGLRPLAVSLTPKADKESKKYISAQSVASGIVKLAVAEAVIAPVEAGIKLINNNPDKFLKKETIRALKGSAENINSSLYYKNATNFIKQSAGFLSAIPKSCLTVALIPFIFDKLFTKKKQETTFAPKKYNSVFDPVCSNPSFKGKYTETIARGAGKILNSKNVQNYAIKNSSKAKNVARNMAVATDVLLTSASVLGIKKSDKIKEEKKPPLIYNNIISTGASIVFGCAVDELVQKCTQNSIKKFTAAHKNDPKLAKYLEGINVLRPTIIFALIYYGVLPVISTYFSDKLDKTVNAQKT